MSSESWYSTLLVWSKEPQQREKASKRSRFDKEYGTGTSKVLSLAVSIARQDEARGNLSMNELAHATPMSS